MSTQAVSGLSIYQELQSFYQNRRSDLQALGTALDSGDLNAAQQAYTQLVSLGQSGPFSNTEPFRRADRAQDFEAIGQALQSGNLTSAQQAFAALESTFGQNNHGGPVPPVYNGGTLPSSGTSSSGGGASTTSLPEIIINLGSTGSSSGSSAEQGSSGPELVINLPAPDNASSPEEVQINLGGSNGSAGEVTIEVGQVQDQNGNTGEQISINLAQAVEETIVLNLFGNGSSSQSQTQGSSLNVQA